jgi:hypothetical protein
MLQSDQASVHSEAVGGSRAGILQQGSGHSDAVATLQPLQVAAPGGGHSDAAATRDALGMESAAKGVAAFLMHKETSPLALAVFGPWGRGKVGCCTENRWIH